MRNRWLAVLIVLTMAATTGALVATADTQPAVTSGSNDNITVVSTHIYKQYPSRLLAFRDGEIIYRDSGEYEQFFDIDPVPGTRTTIEFAGVDTRRCPQEKCVWLGLVRRNLSTRSTTRVWGEWRNGTERRGPSGQESYRWHDIDRINQTHAIVADIKEDSVFIVDLQTGDHTWTWNTSAAFPPSSGGPPHDWTHINDVEVLPDGRIMASLRNQDSVVFLEPGEGIDSEWTLGCDGCLSTLYQQHNPDYLPQVNGGPSVLVADSENDRVIEYRRKGDGWRESWAYSDGRMSWPRDADRLPNGNTLIVDTHGNRVVEVTPGGETVWSADVPQPYDVERLGTGDESSGGPALSGGTAAGHSKIPLLSKGIHGVQFVLPVGTTLTGLAIANASAVVIVLTVVWVAQGLEFSYASNIARR